MYSTKKYDFTIALGLVDFIPCILWGIAMILLGEWFRSFLFIAGAVMCATAGICKVGWKILIATDKPDIKVLNHVFHVLMPTGIVLIGFAILSGNSRGVATSAVIEFILQSTSRFFLALGVVCIILMIVWRVTLDMSTLKSNWIAEITNCFAQGFVLLGVLILVYAGDYYHYAHSYTNEELTEIYNVTMEEHDGYYSFVSNDYEVTEETAGIVFYPGGKVEAQAYIPLMEAIASKGIVAILIEMPDNLAILNYNAAQDVDFRQAYPNVSEWYLAGHSLGAATASMYLAGIKEHAEDMYKGIILLAGYSSKDLRQLHLKALSIYGSEDGVMNRGKYSGYQVNLPSNAEEYIIEGGCHGYFGDYGMQEGDGTPYISAIEQWDTTADIIRDFISS